MLMMEGQRAYQRTDRFQRAFELAASGVEDMEVLEWYCLH